jgi:hypothetical protein
MNKPNFEQIGSLWEKKDGEGGHLIGKIIINNRRFYITVHPNKDKTNEKAPDFHILIDKSRKPMTIQEIMERKVNQLFREVEETIQEEAPPKEGEAQERFMTSITGRGTLKEVRELTDIKLYWSETLKQWVTIPED